MRCDLHVHSIASGMFTAPVLDRICRESYNDPREVYNRLKRLGMSVVTLTDHDSLDGAEVLRRYPDFFLSEEVTVRMPSGTEMHMGVYGLTERDHLEIQRRRTDFIALLMYLTERKLFFSANHVLSGLTGRREGCTNYGGVPGGLARGPGTHPGRARQLPQANARRFQHRQIALLRKPVDSAGFAAGSTGSGIHSESLDPRNSFLPEMDRSAGERRKAPTNVVGHGFEFRGQLGKLR